jgi:hypothetical protein|tara:strand:+ start:2059 stop:2220 length:162 start_codon:yes stop_codon:yes gene_type:complete
MKKNKKEIKSQMEVGAPNGGKEIPTPKAGEVMSEKVRGQKRMLPEKQSIAKWY